MSRLNDWIDTELEVRPWILFVLAMVISVGAVSAILASSSLVLSMNELDLLSVPLNVDWLIAVPTQLDSLIIGGLLANLPQVDSMLTAKSLAGLLALIGMAMLFELVRVYYDARYALLAVVVSVSSNLFLATATSLSNVWISFIIIISLIIVLARISRGSSLGYLALPLLIGALVSLGSNGLVLGLVGLAIVGYNIVRKRIARPEANVAFASLSVAVAVAVAFAIYGRQFGWATLTDGFTMPSLNTWLQNLQLHFIGGNNPFNWPVTWPIFGLASWGLIILGAAVAIKRREAERYKLTLLLCVVYLVALSLPLDDITIALGLLLSSLLITGGLRFIIQNWAQVFPQNQVRHVAAGLMIAALLLTVVNANLTRRFVLLPSQSTNTTQRSVFETNQLIVDFRQNTVDTL